MVQEKLKLGFKHFLAEANAVIETVSVQDLPYLMDDPEALLVDVRETVERQSQGYIPTSVHVPRGLLEFQADPACPAFNSAMDPGLHVVLYCGTGGRSALAAKTLLDMGYRQVSTLAGGVDAWTAAGNRLDKD